jgi:spermidine synthase
VPTQASERVLIVPDDDGRGGVSVLIDGVPSSHLELADPRRLDFEYMRWIGDALDSLPPESPLATVHLGGAGCTLPRYVEATRPGSRQIVYEIDAEVLETVKREFGLRSSSRLRLRLGDGRSGLAALPDASQDVVIRDAFSEASVPEHLRTAEFLDEVRRVLRPEGLYVANLADKPPLRLARAETATALLRFTNVALIAEPAQFKGRRHGNLVLIASASPLPETGLVRRLSSGAVRARYLTADQVRGFAAASHPIHDAIRL